MHETRQKKINEITQRIRRGYKPEKIYLFGSHAWGKPTASSDVDMLIVKRSSQPKRWRTSEVEKLLTDAPYPVDVLVYTPEEFDRRQRLGDFFIRLILKRGRLLYERR